MKKRYAPAALLTAALILSILSGCTSAPKEASIQTIAMDTFITLTAYGSDQGDCQEALEAAAEELRSLDRQLAATDEDSLIYALNHAGGSWVELDGETSAMLEETLALCGLTGGALDITAYPAVQAWGFISGDYRVPGPDELDQLSDLIDYTRLELEGTQIRLPDGMEVELGAVAKGYAGDRLAALLAERGISSALLDLGQSSIQAVGTKPDGSPWRIAVQDPLGDGYLGVLEVSGLAVGTSGGYQRFFEQDGERYWHILDPDTAAPARSGLAGVTVVSPSGLTCDGLSTALFVMGLEEGAQFWRDHPELEFDAIFLSEDGSIAVTAGLADTFSLAQGYEDREVTVLS